MNAPIVDVNPSETVILKEPEPTVLVSAIKTAVDNYRQQYTTVKEQLVQLERNYAQQHELAINTLNQLHGAITGLELAITPDVKSE